MEINLCKLLKGHEGEIFYSPAFGNVEFLGIDDSEECPIKIVQVSREYSEQYLSSSGKFYTNDGECILFPSKDQRDWNKWAEEQKPKIPKTWSELINPDGGIIVIGSKYTNLLAIPKNQFLTPVEKSALALIKIRNLIEAGYGGNITKEEWKDDNFIKYAIKLYNRGEAFIESTCKIVYQIAFHKREQAEEFLSYPENIQLVRDFYMI